MRFDELVIEKYGSYEKLALPLTGKPGLVVIYGPNEAGKSTCLAAISDFLYGIAHNSSYGQVFGNDQIRLTALVQRASGESFTLRRRKGRGLTLTDGDGKPVEEATLLGLLGPVERPKFNSLFGLNHESLREGGKRLLAAEGDIGRLIVEAGGGLRVLVEKLEGLGASADRLFTPRKSGDREFYKALAAFEGAEREVRAGLVTRDDYETARNQQESAMSTLEDLKKSQRAQSERIIRQQRLAQLIPLLQEFDGLEQKVKSFTGLPTLPSGFVKAVRDGLASRKLTHQALEEAERERVRLEFEIEGLVIRQEVLELEVPIRDIRQRAIKIKSQRTDRPNREKELADLDRSLFSLKHSIGAAPDADLAPLMPSKEAIERVQQLAADGMKRRPTVESFEKQVADDSDNIEALEQRNSERTTAGQHEPFGISASEFASLSAQEKSREKKQTQLDRAEQDIDRRLRGTPFASAEKLRAFECPAAGTIQAEVDKRAALESELLKYATTLTAQAAQREAATSEIARLKRGGEVPTDAAINAARQERSAVWLPIKTAYLANDAQALLALPLSQRNNVVVQLETRIAEADSLADRKSIEASRIASLNQAEKIRDEAVAVLATVTKAVTELEANRCQMRQSWVDTWGDAAKVEPELGRLQELALTRQDLLGKVDAAQSLRAEVEQMVAEIEPRVEALALAEQKLGIIVGAKASLVSRIQTVTQRIMIHEEGYRSFRDDLAAMTSMRAKLKRKRAQLAMLNQSELDWLAEWKPATRQLGLPEEVLLARANEVATQWAIANGTFQAIKLTLRRLTGMDKDEQDLKMAVGKVSLQLGLVLPEDPVAAAEMLEEKLQTASQLVTKRSALAPQLASRTKECDARKQALEKDQRLIDALCSEAKCTEAALLSVADQQEQLLAAREEHRQVSDRVLSAGDGNSVEYFREQLGNRTLDEISAEQMQMEADAEQIASDMVHAIAQVESCKANLASFQTEQGMNHAVADRERAAAELHQVVDHYVELSLAKALLATAIDRLRHEQQNPLIRRAGELFALTTKGAFTAVEAEVDNKGSPVIVGKRATGGPVAIDMMSDGTRDQLFLSFRLAHIEQYCRTAEPLPFIADDLLVNFDDARSAATLQLLAELGKTTQVLLFTHHQSVRDTAQTLAALEGVSFIEFGS